MHVEKASQVVLMYLPWCDPLAELMDHTNSFHLHCPHASLANSKNNLFEVEACDIQCFYVISARVYFP